jgi:hypothetical protein
MVTESMVLAIARSLERLLADAMFGVSLILGWNLFRVGVLKDQAAEFSGNGWKFRLQRVGPGIFFALFGAIGLVVALERPLQQTTTHTDEAKSVNQESRSSEVRQSTYSESTRTDLADYITALTTVEFLGIRDDGTHSAEHDALLKAKPILEKHRDALLRNAYPDYDWYLGVKKTGGLQTRGLTPSDAKKYDSIDEIVNKTLVANQ